MVLTDVLLNEDLDVLAKARTYIEWIGKEERNSIEKGGFMYYYFLRS